MWAVRSTGEDTEGFFETWQLSYFVRRGPSLTAARRRRGRTGFVAPRHLLLDLSLVTGVQRSGLPGGGLTGGTDGSSVFGFVSCRQVGK